MHSPPCFTPTPRGFCRAFSKKKIKKSTSSRVIDQTTAAAAAASSIPGRRVSLKFHSLTVLSHCLDFWCHGVNKYIPSGLVIFLFLNVPLASILLFLRSSSDGRYGRPPDVSWEVKEVPRTFSYSKLERDNRGTTGGLIYLEADKRSEPRGKEKNSYSLRQSLDLKLRFSCVISEEE